MAKRISTEARLLEWIDTAPIEVVSSIMGIASARVKARVKASQPAPVVRSRTKPSKTPKDGQRVNGTNSPALAFPGEGVTGASA